MTEFAKFWLSISNWSLKLSADTSWFRGWCQADVDSRRGSKFGSSDKGERDHRSGILRLPFTPVGFVPSTESDYGDPVDVLVLMDEPAFPGCVLACRPIGVIEGEQGDKKNKDRNDRIIALQEDAHSWADIATIDD
jgi:hypothetical protein